MANITGNSLAANSSTSPSNTNFSLSPRTTQYVDKDFAHQMTAELVPISVIIILANLLVFVLFCLRSNLRTPTNYFLIGLAFADFLTGAVNIPLFLAVLYGFRNTGIDLSIWHSFTATLCAYHILVITAEKFFAIMRPLRHYQMTKKSALSITLLVWCCSSFLVFIQLAWGSNSDGEASRLKQTIYVLFNDVIVFIVPYAFMIYAYWTMFRAISRSKEKLLHGQRGTSFVRKLKQNRAERKCLIVFALMALVYAMCWFPWFTFVTLLQLKYPPTKLMDALHVYVIVRYLTSAFNPIIYTFFKRDFKVALKSLLLRKSAKAEARETLLKSFRYRSNTGCKSYETRYSPAGSITMDSTLPLRLSPLPDRKHPTSFLRLHPQSASWSRRRSLSSIEQIPTNSSQKRNNHRCSRNNNAERHISFCQKESLRSYRSEPSIKDATFYVSSV